MAPDTNGKWIEVPLSDDASHETVESITKSIVRKKGVWDSRIIRGNPCGTDLLPENRLWLDGQNILGEQHRD